MHVLIIPSWYPTYQEDIAGSFFREQAQALRKQGCKVGVISPQLRSLHNWRSIFTGKSGLEVENDEGIATYRSHGMNWFPRVPSLASKFWVRHGCRLYEQYIAVHGEPDVIHVHSIFNAGVLAAEIYKRYSIPFVITEHSSAFACGLVSAQGISFANNIVALAEVKLAVSSEFALLLDKMLGDKSRSWGVMPNMVNKDFCDYPLPLRINNKDFKFINIAKMTEIKKQTNIILAFSEVFKFNLDVTLTIGGEGPEMLALKNISSQLGVSDRIKLTGKLSRQQVLKEMVASDAFVLSSSYETFGVVVIEALALGKPVIATRCGGPESIVREQDGVLVPIDDVSSLAAAMRYVYENRHKYDAAGIRAACKMRYSESAVAQRLMAIYSDIVEAHAVALRT